MLEKSPRCGSLNVETKQKLQRYVTLVTAKFKDKEIRINLCAVSSADYINFLISKGKIYLSDKEICCDYVLDLIIAYEKSLMSNLPVEMINNFTAPTREHNKRLMLHKQGYDYETLSFFLKQLT